MYFTRYSKKLFNIIYTSKVIIFLVNTNLKNLLCSHVKNVPLYSTLKASIVLTRPYHFCIYTYIKSLLNIILRLILLVLKPCPTVCLLGCELNKYGNKVEETMVKP